MQSHYMRKYSGKRTHTDKPTNTDTQTHTDTHTERERERERESLLLLAYRPMVDALVGPAA